MSLECDVLIIGAGPAGASAALAAALKGQKVICIEKKSSAGSEIRCAEGVGKYLIPYLPFELPKRIFEWKIDGMIFNYQDKQIKREGSFWEGYGINRRRLEEYLVQKAIDAGARFSFNCELTDLTQNEMGYVTEVTVKEGDVERIIKPKIVIAADGVDSKTLELIGELKPERIIEVVSWEIEGIDLENPTYESIFFKEEYCIPGYGYIFPKAKDKANIGVGGELDKKNAKRLFDEFVLSLGLKGDETWIAEKSKRAVWGKQSEKTIYQNVAVCGDAANHNIKPFIEGIIPSIISGYTLGGICPKGVEGLSGFNEEFKKALDLPLKESTVFEDFVRMKDITCCDYVNRIISSE